VCQNSNSSVRVVPSPKFHFVFSIFSLSFINRILGLSISAGCGLNEKLAIGLGLILIIFSIELLQLVIILVY